MPQPACLTRDSDLAKLLVTVRSQFWVAVVKDKGDTRLGDACLALLVDEFVQACSAHLTSLDRNVSLRQQWGAWQTDRRGQAHAGRWHAQHACDRLEMPRTKQIESRILDLPEPFRPVMALNSESKPEMMVRFAYDLKPSRMISTIRIGRELPHGRTGSW